MACLQQNNIVVKRTEKLTKYKELALKTRKCRPGSEICVVLAIVRALGAEIKTLKVNSKKIFSNNELVD